MGSHEWDKGWMKDVKPEIRTDVTENGKERPGSLLKFNEIFFIRSSEICT
jgi:hypothetical protein